MESRVMTRSAAVFLGAGFSVAAGLPATSNLMDGQVWATSATLFRRLNSVLHGWQSWRERTNGDVAEFLHQCYQGNVGDASPGCFPGTTLPWAWVSQYLAIRLSEHTTGSAATLNPRYRERLTVPTHAVAHKRLFADVIEKHMLTGVITTN